MSTRERKLEAALRLLYDETADYIRVNNLGDVHHNLSMRMARNALTTVPTSEWNEAIEAAVKKCDELKPIFLSETNASYLVCEMLATAIRALKHKEQP